MFYDQDENLHDHIFRIKLGERRCSNLHFMQIFCEKPKEMGEKKYTEFVLMVRFDGLGIQSMYSFNYPSVLISFSFPSNLSKKLESDINCLCV